jgi:hypothetical protein
MDFVYDTSADAALSEFEQGSNPAPVKQAVSAVLAQFEEDPNNSRWRKRRYQSPPVFGFTIRTSVDNYLILWRMETVRSDPAATEDTIIVEYFGPDI